MMRFFTSLTVLCLSAVTLATPAPKSDSLSAWEDTGNRPSEYGFFKSPKIPKMPSWTSVTVKPTDGNSTSKDASENSYSQHNAEHRGKWSPGFNINTDMNERWPTTGRTVRYTFTITNQTLAPEGVPKQMLVVNGQYPGPPITANWGDYIEVTVVNAMKTNGTSMHWHGFRMLENNLADGAGGATECPIAPGDSKVYRFQATQYGSSWYHSHFSVQYGDGVLGPIIINGPSSANYDIDLGTVLVSDWYARTAAQEDYDAHRKGPPRASNYLINGKNVAVGGATGERAKFTFTPGKKHLLRLVNTAMDGQFKVSIDGHTLQVIATDFVPIVPYTTNEVSINIGQRYHVIVEAKQKPGNYYLRAMAAMDCTNTANPGTGNANAIVSYSNAPNVGSLPTSTATNHTNTCIDEPQGSLVPIVAQSVDSSKFLSTVKTSAVDIKVETNPEFVFFWTLGGISQILDWNKPVIQQAVTGNMSYATQKNIQFLNGTDRWVYWVIQNKFFVPHPMHLHGHDFNLLGQGVGTFNPSTDMANLNFKNPARRDVATLPAQGWTVIAFKSDNPGAWLMHCHIAWHAGEGLSQVFIERPADIPKVYGSQVKSNDFSGICKNWNTYQKNAVWKQYDSGLKRRSVDGGGEVLDWASSRYIQMKEKMYSKRRTGGISRRW